MKYIYEFDIDTQKMYMHWLREEEDQTLCWRRIENDERSEWHSDSEYFDYDCYECFG